MILKPAIAAMLASGFIVPEKPRLVLPKPAIMRPQSIEFPKHMLPGMPLTMGMLAAKGTGPHYIPGNESGSSSANATSRSWSHTTTSDTNCLVVTAFCNNNAGTANISTATFNGVSMTRDARTTVGSQGQVAIFTLFNPPTGTYTVTVTYSGGDRGVCASAVNFGGCSSVHVAGTTNQTTSSTITTTVTSTLQGIPVGSTSTTIAGSGTITHTYTSPGGMYAGYTHSFLSNSNRKFHTTSVLEGLLPAGSNSLSVLDNVSAAGRHQAFIILV